MIFATTVFCQPTRKLAIESQVALAMNNYFLKFIYIDRYILINFNVMQLCLISFNKTAMANDDFFLQPDDAKSLGDVNFMRKSVRVRRTFPKTKKNPNGFEVVKEVSSVDAKNFNGFNGNETIANNFSSVTNNKSIISGNGSYGTNGNGNGSVNGNNASANSPETTSEPKKVDNNLDMFRNMARQIKR